MSTDGGHATTGRRRREERRKAKLELRVAFEQLADSITSTEWEQVGKEEMDEMQEQLVSVAMQLNGQASDQEEGACSGGVYRAMFLEIWQEWKMQRLGAP